jgi:hypothetical protein
LFVELAPVSLSVLLIVGQLQNLVAVDVHLSQRRFQLGVDELFLFGAFGFGLLALFFELILQLAVPVDALIHGLELLFDCLLLLLHALQDVLQLLLQLQIGGSQLGCQLLYRRLVAVHNYTANGKNISNTDQLLPSGTPYLRRTRLLVAIIILLVSPNLNSTLSTNSSTFENYHKACTYRIDEVVVVDDTVE